MKYEFKRTKTECYPNNVSGGSVLWQDFRFHSIHMVQVSRDLPFPKPQIELTWSHQPKGRMPRHHYQINLIGQAMCPRHPQAQARVCVYPPGENLVLVRRAHARPIPFSDHANRHAWSRDIGCVMTY